MTGGTGFVGGHLIRAALDKGHKIRALVRRPEAVTDFTHENLSWIKGSLGTNDAKLLQGCDVVIHLAGLIKARKTSDFYEINADAAGTLAKAADEARVKRYVLLSSMAAREPELSDYAGSKRAGERAVLSSFTGKTAIVRAPAVFGPGDKATEPFFKLLAKGLLPVPGGRKWKERQLSMVYVVDLADDILRAAKTGCYDGEIVSPANIDRVDWLEFGNLCEKAFNRRVKVFPLPLSVLYPVAGVTSITSRLMGMGHLTLDKLGELLHADWSSETLILGATPPIEALKITMESYMDSNTRPNGIDRKQS